MLSQSIQVLRRTNKHRISCFNQDMVLISSKQKMMYIYHVYIYNWHYIHIYMMYIYTYISCKWCNYIYIHSHYFWQNPFSTLASTYFYWWNPDPFRSELRPTRIRHVPSDDSHVPFSGPGGPSWCPRSWRLSLGSMDDNGIV
jgi:hypothetical protein